MTYRKPAGRPTRQLPTILIAGLLVVVAVAASVGFPFRSSASSPAPSFAPGPSLPPRSFSNGAPPPSSPPGASTIESLGRGHRGALGRADGLLPDAVTVFDDEYPGISNLDPALLGAVRRAASDAAEDGVVAFYVDSGWRSRKYQDQLFRQAVSRYGSKAKAARWVAIPGTSTHESGDAVDLGPVGATAWLSEHGATYGLCQIYRNEPWHYELRPVAIDHGCPRMYAHPSHDPWMQR
jgi:D-alanyl-D-alanine carboxypeptidase